MVLSNDLKLVMMEILFHEMDVLIRVYWNVALVEVQVVLM